MGIAKKHDHYLAAKVGQMAYVAILVPELKAPGVVRSGNVYRTENGLGFKATTQQARRYKNAASNQPHQGLTFVHRRISVFSEEIVVQ